MADKPERSVVLGTGVSDLATSYGEPVINLLLPFLQRYDRPHTRRAYRQDLVHFFGAVCITLDMVQRISFMQINAYIDGLEKDGMKASTVKRRVSAIRSFFDWLEALQVLDHNPAKKQLIRRVRKTSSKDRSVFFLSAEEAGRLIEAADSARGDAAVRDRGLIVTLLHCVLRRSEAAHMDVHHIRPLGHYWVLDLPSTKGGADQYIKIPSHVVEAIEVVKDHYGITKGPIWRSLSNNSKGNRLSPTSIYSIVRQTAKRAGLPDIGAHVLRHTGCTLAIEAGASIQQVQAHARHRSLETTMVYVHQRDRLRDSAADFILIKDS